jgi:hypothetical protein
MISANAVYGPWWRCLNPSPCGSYCESVRQNSASEPLKLTEFILRKLGNTGSRSIYAF